MTKKIDNSIVYAAFDEKGVCLYVGEGKPDRWKHIISGCSHVYNANMFHFTKKTVEVRILKENLSKSDAVKMEQKYINELKPLWNKFNCTSSVKASLLDYAKTRYNEYKKCQPNRFFSPPREEFNFTVIDSICRLMNNEGVAIISQHQLWYRGQNKIRQGFLSTLSCSKEGFYRVLKHIFHVERDSENKTYTVTLKDYKP